MEYDVIREIVDGVKGTKFASMDTETKVTLLGGKANPMKGRVTKRNLGSQIILTNTPENVYSNMVKTRLIREGKNHEDFEVKPRKWGKKIGDTCLVEHTTKDGEYKVYLETLFLYSGKSKYYLDGVEIEPECIQGLKVEDDNLLKANGEEKAVQQGGLDDKVVIRTFDINSIIAIRVNGEAFI